MKNFDVISVRCCPCFVNVISEAMRLDPPRPYFSSVEFVDFVWSRKEESLHTKKLFLLAKLINERFILKKCFGCYGKSLKKLFKLLVLFTMKVKFKMFSCTARNPTQGTIGSAGYDLFSVEEKVVLPCSSTLIQTDFGFKTPGGYFGKIHPRFSHAVRFFGVGGGVRDSNYRGRVSVAFLIFQQLLTKFFLEIRLQE